MLSIILSFPAEESLQKLRASYIKTVPHRYGSFTGAVERQSGQRSSSLMWNASAFFINLKPRRGIRVMLHFTSSVRCWLHAALLLTATVGLKIFILLFCITKALLTPALRKGKYESKRKLQPTVLLSRLLVFFVTLHSTQYRQYSRQYSRQYEYYY